MALLWAQGEEDDLYRKQTESQRDIETQAIISIALGVIALTAFCLLRPRWTSLYAARKKQKTSASILPELPDTFFGWIPALYRITEEQVLASAGLDAYVFLTFFRLAVKFIAVTFFFQLVVMLPVHHYDVGDWGLPSPVIGNQTDNSTESSSFTSRPSILVDQAIFFTSNDQDEKPASERMLWLYVFFVWLFSALMFYLIVTETRKIIRVRQAYLGSQSTVTDRTIRLSGIPEELRSEEMIKETIENLQIGKVESVLLCRDWKELDDLVAQRMVVLRKLENAWTTHLSSRGPGGKQVPSRNSSNELEDDGNESSRLLDDTTQESNHEENAAARPLTRIWFGFLGLQSRKIDAIDCYQEKLRKLDEQIKSSRQKIFKPTPLAFVTLDSTAAAVSCILPLIFVMLKSSSKWPCKLPWTQSL